ncbi:hypothetical protein [Oceanibacterium hippocampi]|uniref:Cysteine dioxygenase type I n=1 Tax=Oceanibacterium hippocampi TaxID=745714 RepID=A0A1Y5TTB8_9PROT|nr:hypothetical protein [Oceanibacterium hippocampi]SLN72111.1 hypothetical protein OCH7691_03429 [Oceanibacterium hippocampi]
MTDITVRACAQAIVDAVERFGDDRNGLTAALRVPLGALARRDDLRDLGVPRQGNNVAFSSYLYFDGELSILLFEIPHDRAVPPHDHGVWEGFCVYRGKVRHSVYRRADDGTVDGFAELETVEESDMGPGDLSIVTPPADIHGFQALEEGSLGITVVNGVYKPERLYYQPEAKTYVVKTPNNPR